MSRHAIHDIMKIARNLFDATVLAFQVQSCEDMMQSIEALKSCFFDATQCNTLDH